MTFNNFRSIKGLFPRSAFLIVLALLCICCQFATDIPLQNSKPQFVGVLRLEKSLLYPDTAVGSVQVRDLNDTAWSVETHFYADSIPDTGHGLQISWPGSIFFQRENPQISNCLLSVKPEFLGYCRGTLTLRDPDGDTALMPISVHRVFKNDFNPDSIGLRYWREYTDNDSFIAFDRILGGLRFTIPGSSGDVSSETLRTTTGMRSAFAISGDFQMSTAFELRDDMKSGFETSFFISTSPDPSLWSGEIAGIYLTGISGVNDFVQLICNSIYMQTTSSETVNYMGILTISRTNNSLMFTYQKDRLDKPTVLATLEYPAADSIYVHLRMQVNDRAWTRHCLWKDFEIVKGTISF